MVEPQQVEGGIPNVVAGPLHRPLPRIPSLIAVIGGVLVVFGFLQLIGEMPNSGQRVLAILTSIGLEAVGVGLLWFWRGRPAHTGAIALTLLAILPAWFFMVIDVHASSPIHGTSDFKTKATVILLLATLGWLALHYLAPVRQHIIYSGMALVALALIAVIQIAVPSHGLNIGRELTSIPGSSFSSNSSGSDCTTDPNTGATDCSGTDSSSTDSSSTDSSSTDSSTTDCTDSSSYCTSGPDVFNPAANAFLIPFLFFSAFERGKLATVAILFGLAYLIAAAVLDRRRRSRAATPFFAVGVPITIIGFVISATTDFGLWGASLVGLAVALATLWLAVSAARRATAWIATLGAFSAVLAIVTRLFERSNVGLGFAVMIVGIAVLVGADRLTNRVDPFPCDDGRLPGRPGSLPPTHPLATAAPIPPPEADTPPPVTAPSSAFPPPEPLPPQTPPPPMAPFRPPS